MTIVEAIKAVMRARGSPMTAREAYDAIVVARLYEFHAQDPAHVVVQQIRRHCVGLDFPRSGKAKHFKLAGDNKYVALDAPLHSSRRARNVRRPEPSSTELSTLVEIRALHVAYVGLLKQRLLNGIRELSPAAFEMFAKELLDVYGFEDMRVTRVSADGGIDGYGRLNVGLAHLNVAFQCKRWTRANVQRTEIDRFRGATQGEFEQGYFFATTSFSRGAINASIKRGAIPVVLVDGARIVELMIEKEFGVQIGSLPIPTYALDLALTPENRGGGVLTPMQGRP